MPHFADVLLRYRTEGHEKSQKSLADTRKGGAAAEKAVDGMGAGFVRAGRSAVQARPKIEGFNSAADRTRAVALAGTKVLARMAIGFTSFAAAGVAVRAISEFESSVSKMGAISGATTAELASMRDVAKELGSTTEFSAKQAADGLTFLAMAGFEASESMAAIPAVLDLATSAGIGLAQAADTASNIMSGFGIAATEAASVSDVLAAASSRANTSVSQLGGAMSTVAPIASALDIGLADTAAAIGVLSDAGIQGERAGTAMRGVLASLAGPTAQAEAVINQLGLTIQGVDPATNSLSEVMGRLGEAGLSTADAMTLFGREAASGALVLIDGATRLGEFGQELRNVDGAASDMAGTMRDNLRGDIDGLQSAVSGLMLAMGDAGLTAIMRGVVSAATGVTQAFIAVFNSIASIGDAIASLGLFQSTTDALALSADVANIAIADEIAQIGALTVATGDAVVVSEVAALNKLREAEAHLESAAAKQAEARATILNSDAYQGLIQSIETGRDALRSMNSESAIGAAAYEEAEQSLVDMLNRQQEMLALIPATSAEYANAAAKVEDLRNRIAEAKDGTVILKGEVAGAADTTAALARLSGGINFSGAVSSAADLAKNLGISLALARQIALIGGNTGASGPDEAVSQVRNAYGWQDLIKQGKIVTRVFEAVSKSARSAGSAGRAAASATQSAIDKLRQQITQERELIGLSDTAKAQIDARHQVERALAQDKAEWSKAEITALSDQILMNQRLREEAEKTSQVVRTIADGIARGDIKSIGSGLLGQAQSGFSDLLQTAYGHADGFFSGIKSGFKGVFDGISSAWTKGVGIIGRLGGALGAALPVIGAVSAAISFFRSKTVDLDKGVRVLVDGLETATVKTYLLQEKTKFWGLSKKKTETVRTADYDVADPIQAAVNSIGQTVLDFADILGLASDNLDKVKFEFDISTAGKNEEQIQKAIEAEMERLGNAFADAAIGSFTEYLPDQAEIERLQSKIAATYNIGGEGGEDRGKAQRALIDQQIETAKTAIEVVHLNGALSDLQKEGEGSFDLLQRVVSELGGVNTSLTLFGRRALELSVSSAEAASKLVTLSGGLEAFSAKTQFVFENMLTEQAQKTRLVDLATSKLNSTLGALGIVIPDTHAEFMALLDAQDLTTDAGRNTHAALLDVAQAFVTVKGTAQSAADSLKAQVDAAQNILNARAAAADQGLTDAERALRASFQSERDRISDSYDAQLKAANASAEAAELSSRISIQSARDRVELSRTIRGILDDAYQKRVGESIDGQAMQIAQARQFLRDSIAAGGTTDQDRLRDAIDVLADPSKDLFSSFSDYQHEFDINTNLIDELRGLTDDALSVEQRTLTSIERQTRAYSSGSSAQVLAITSARDAQLSALDRQMNALLGIDDSVLSLGDAIRQFKNAEKEAENAKVKTTSGLEFQAGSFGAQLNAIYENELGRSVRQAGLDFYGGHYANGLSLADIANDIANSDEAKRYRETGNPIYHTGGVGGFAPDEFSATLKRGEEVLPEYDPRHRSNLRPASSNHELVAELRAVRAELVEVKESMKKQEKDARTRTNALNEMNQEGVITRTVAT